ncbi:hypothetical protein QJQ45_020903 [Haematococcus lacustris]|nr:hypothetical protein QJQ45_020903 [Haematococcus lacustris]
MQAVWLAFAFVASLKATSICSLTTNDSVVAGLELRNALFNRSLNWAKALKTWTCPTDPASSEQACDICSNDWSGNWGHLHCRGAKATECGGAVVDGVQDVNLDGPVPRQFCALRNLREFDVDGGQLTGPIPRWLLEPNPDPAANDTLCGSNIQELDLSSNRLSGTIPPELSIKKSMQEFKIEHNYVTGTLPESFGQLPDLWRIRLATNQMYGRLPRSLSKLTATLNELWLDNNDFEGDLYMLGPTKLVWVTVHNNPRLCGMVPASVRWAHGYNPAGTNLGNPC